MDFVRLDDEDEGDREKEPTPPAHHKVAESLFKARIVLLFGEITQKVAQGITAQLLALSHDG